MRLDAASAVALEMLRQRNVLKANELKVTGTTLRVDDLHHLECRRLCPDRYALEDVRATAAAALGQPGARRPMHDPRIAVRGNRNGLLLRLASVRLSHGSGDYGHSCRIETWRRVVSEYLLLVSVQISSFFRWSVVYVAVYEVLVVLYGCQLLPLVQRNILGRLAGDEEDAELQQQKKRQKTRCGAWQSVDRHLRSHF